MIRAIIFDCFGVLVHGSLGYLYTLTPPEKHEQLRDLNRSSDYGYITLSEYVAGIAELVGRSPSEVLDIIRSHHLRDEQAIDFVRQMKAAGYKTALLSNVAHDVMGELFAPEEQVELFDVVVLSCSVGMTKPSREIYVYTVDKLAVAPEEAVMVDDLASNVEGARRAGLMAVQYATLPQLKNELNLLSRA